MTLVDYNTGEITPERRAEAEARASRITAGLASIQAANDDLRALGYTGGRRVCAQHLYFIEAVGTNTVKIGRAADPQQRLAQLQTGSPVPLRLIRVVLGKGGDEQRWHKGFADQRVRGEWFALDDVLRICIATERDR